MSVWIEKIAKNDQKKIASLPFKCNLKSPGASINLYTEFNNLNFDQKGNKNILSGMIPGWQLGTQSDEQSSSLFTLNNEESAFFYDQNTGRSFLSGKQEDFSDGQTIGWAAYWMMEAQRQVKSLFTLHSSALTIDNKGVLLFGHSGSGKTSVMLDLCRRFGGEVQSNDLTVIGHNILSDNIDIIEGTREIRLRFSSISKNFSDLVPLFSDRTNISSWENKIIVTPEQLGLRSVLVPKNLVSIFEIHLDSKEQDPLLVKEETGKSIQYRLYEDMSRIVRGSAISIFNRNNNILGYMPSLDTEEMHDKRVECIDCMVKRRGIISVSGGSLNDISKTIYRIVSSN
jgi:hypothetical protein